MEQCSIKGLSKSYNNNLAIDNLDLSINPGEILCILGPSGCGKSTLLKLISGLEKPDSGSIEIVGKCVASTTPYKFIPPEKRGLSLMFQNYALWPHMTVFKNIAYPLSVRGVDNKVIDSEVGRMLSMIRLDNSAHKYPYELSGGEQQRVALARALIVNPTLLLLDEPFSNLDARLREDMQYELKSIVQTLGLTVIHVTHDQAEAMALADRIVVMNKGHIEQIDTPSKLYDMPQTLFTAKFMGKSNIFDSTNNPIATKTLFGDTSLTYLVRLSDVVIGGSGKYEARVEDVVFEGVTKLVTLTFKDSSITARVDGKSNIVVGDTILFDVVDYLSFNE